MTLPYRLCVELKQEKVKISADNLLARRHLIKIEGSLVKEVELVTSSILSFKCFNFI